MLKMVKYFFIKLFKFNKKNLQGFTLIELLIIIAIIAFISMAAMASLGNARTKARSAKLAADFKIIRDTIEYAQHEQGKVLKDITGSSCSDCSCRPPGVTQPLNTLPDSHVCITLYKNWLRKLGLSTGLRDPWGSPYFLDENEYEYVADPCRRDLLRSAGPDKNFGGTDDLDSDEINFFLCN